MLVLAQIEMSNLLHRYFSLASQVFHHFNFILDLPIKNHIELPLLVFIGIFTIYLLLQSLLKFKYVDELWR